MKNDFNKEKTKLYYWALFTAILVILFVSVAFGIVFGSADLSFSTVWQVIKFKLFAIESPDLSLSTISIVWELRLPRVLLAIAAGGGLAVAGAAMQAVTQNVLADPYILGASSGASAFVAVSYVIGGSFFISSYGVSLFAFFGAIISLLLVYSIGIVGGSGSGNRLVLAGMAVSVILNAATQFFISISPNALSVRSIVSWMMGSLSSARWHNLSIPFFGTIIGSLVFIFSARAYNIISLGDDTAISLGIDANRIKKWTIIIVSFITGIVVAAGGIIGFVGFIIPHIVRILIGSDHRRLFPLSFITGGLFLVWMDILARTVMAPQELAIGILTASCGGPFFIWLLYRKNKHIKKKI